MMLKPTRAWIPDSLQRWPLLRACENVEVCRFPGLTLIKENEKTSFSLHSVVTALKLVLILSFLICNVGTRIYSLRSC